MKKLVSWLLITVLLLSCIFTVSCSNNDELYRTAVGKVGSYDVYYEELRWLTMQYKDLMAASYGADIWENKDTAEKYREELESAVADCRYPPEGTRGCGLRRAIHYGAKSTETYFAESEREPLIIAQIEHIDAVLNLDEILKVKHLGSICIGPYDLSGSMNKFASPDDPEVGKVVDEICEKAHRAGIPVGAFVSDVEKWRKRNLNWAALTTDYGALFRNCTQLINQFNEK